MASVVRRAISLPREQDRQVQALAKSRHAPYSAVIRSALEVFLKMGKRQQIEEVYARYYSNKRQTEETLGIAREYLGLSEKVWP